MKKSENKAIGGPMELFTYVLDKKGRRKVNLGSFLWFLSFLLFWFWWVTFVGIYDSTLYAINSVILFMVTAVPGWFLFFLMRMKEVNPNLDIPRDKRVAMIVTRVPSSEPISLVKDTLIAMLNQDVDIEYDVWLADENPEPEMIRWCNKNRVKISTRVNSKEYHQKTWPKRTKSKEGNLSYFYDKVGYDNYDIVAQFDADHIPSTDYLRYALPAFNDEKTGYVAAPSICSKNEKESWTARGRLYAEAFLHGPIQLGWNSGFSPLCIGSHYTVSVQALKDIGGIGPELAEDHSTSLLLNAGGYHGAFAHKAIAIGDGPNNFYDGMKQEFQWSRSLLNLLFKYTPRALLTLSNRKRFQFIFSQIWYIYLVSYSFAGFLIPLIAILNNSPFADANYLEFLILMFIQQAATLGAMYQIKEYNLLRPMNAKLFSWEALVFNIVRWPWVLMGLFYSIIDIFKKEPFVFKVTPKGSNTKAGDLKFKHIWFYVFMICVSSLILLFKQNSRIVAGYYYLLSISTIMSLVALIVVIVMHYKEGTGKLFLPVKYGILILGLNIIIFSAINTNFDKIEFAIRYTIERALGN